MYGLVHASGEDQRRAAGGASGNPILSVAAPMRFPRMALLKLGTDSAPPGSEYGEKSLWISDLWVVTWRRAEGGIVT